MDQVLNRLSEWKEKILFGVVVLATLAIVMKARPIGGGIVDIDAEQRQAAISAAGIDQAQAEKVLTKLEKPGEWTPVQLDNLRVERPFYEEDDRFKAAKPTGWSLSQESYESLPPVQLSVPGFNSLPDYDMPAGPRPSLARAQAHVPRDERPVTLTRESSPEFD
ncbi:MAG: hypothetical protein M5U25_15005 [Planctomycetota bacterium]|nr:hypothetical protein [Planctomycetota bacterium]